MISKRSNPMRYVIYIYAPKTENRGILRGLRQIKRFLQLLYYTNKAVKQKHYDFIYCKAFEGVAGQIIAKNV